MTLTISEFAATGYKGLDEVVIRPNGNLVLICGRNGQGKSSVLDAMWAALQGAKAAREVDKPIRDGQSKAIVRLEISDETGRVKYLVTRRWTKNDGGTLTVEAPDRAKYGTPQALLDATMGAISFDPAAFLRQDAKAQLSTLIAALGDSLGFDPDEIERRRKGIYDARTAVGQKVRDLEGQIAALPELDPTLPEAEVTASTVMSEWDAATAHNEKRRRAWDTVSEYTSDLSKAETVLREAEEAAARARDRRDFLVQELASAESYAGGLSPDYDTDAIRARLDDIDATNRKIRAQVHRRAILAELDDRRREVTTFTDRLADIAREKADGIAAAALPVPGLSFNDEGVLYRGVPFGDASRSERMRISAGIGMSANPELRVMRIDDGEALDSESLAVLDELAEEHGYQVWISKVSEGSPVGFTIESGRVASIDGVPA